MCTKIGWAWCGDKLRKHDQELCANTCRVASQEMGGGVCPAADLRALARRRKLAFEARVRELRPHPLAHELLDVSAAHGRSSRDLVWQPPLLHPNATILDSVAPIMIVPGFLSAAETSALLQRSKSLTSARSAAGAIGCPVLRRPCRSQAGLSIRRTLGVCSPR
jgi:hypothetical protein